MLKSRAGNTLLVQ